MKLTETEKLAIQGIGAMEQNVIRCKSVFATELETRLGVEPGSIANGKYSINMQTGEVSKTEDGN